MEDCCCSGEAAGLGGVPERCPECGATGRPVERVTLKHMVKPQFLEVVNKPGFRFCGSLGYDVVYFHGDGKRLGKADVRVRVGLKESEDPVPICYCFGFTAGMVKEEIRTTGRCTIPERITAEVKAGHCACEIRNPQGSCCLGNMTTVVKRLLAGTAKDEPGRRSEVYH